VDWTNIKSTAAALVADLSGFGPAGVKWRDAVREPTYGYQAIVYLRVASLRQQGTDEEFYDDAPGSGTDDMAVTVVGRRGFTLSIRCESSTTDLASAQHPLVVLERLAVRLRRTSTAQRLSDLGAFAVAQVEAIQYAPYVEQGKHVECYVLDVQCNAFDVDVDDTLDAGGFVDEVKLGPASVKESADGSALGSISLDVDSGPTDVDP